MNNWHGFILTNENGQKYVERKALSVKRPAYRSALPAQRSTNRTIEVTFSQI